MFVANDYGISELWFNDGNRFREVGKETGVGFAPKSGMNASVGDVLNQGRFALYVSKFGAYDKTYGTLAGLVILLLWFWITNLAILFGHQMNAERERGDEGGSPA